MSTSEDPDRDAARITALLAGLRGRTGDAAPGAIGQDTLCALLAEVTRLYAAQSTTPRGDVVTATLRTTPTEACTAAAALLHAQSLTPFEFSIWWSASTPERGAWPCR
jgi:hypothetical protein